jgi:TetR/AcrR family transcriptional regulator, regulator of cefoperazone and chloramphenicol sensitivity
MTPTSERTPSPTPDLAATRQRLLDAAGEVFAEVGYRAATIREICTRAEANVAAVNYHFRDKDGLYQEVVAYAHGCAMASHPPPGDLARLTPAEQLQGFVRSFLARLLDSGRPAWHGRLMARELVEPTAALDRIVRDSIRAQSEMLMGIVRAVAGVPLPLATVRRAAMSVVGQCLFYEHARPVIGRLFPDLGFSRTEVEALADHISAFSLAGIASLADIAALARPAERKGKAISAPKRSTSSKRRSRP